MSNPIQIVLPVMLHFEQEIKIFNEAKERIERLGDDCGVPVEVGAFLLYLPTHSRKPENFERQIENQKKNRLPIRLVETGVQRNNSLVYSPEDPTYNPEVYSDLERTIKQVAILRDLDGTGAEPLVVAPHVGIIVVDSLKAGDFSRPSFYSVKDFVERRDELYARAKNRFAELKSLALSKGLCLGLENAFSAVYEDASFWTGNKGAFGMEYQPFNDLHSLTDISAGNLVFDAAHFAAMRNTPKAFKANSDIINPDSLFAALGIKDWGQFSTMVGKSEEYLAKARALHLSHTDGLGIRVPKGSSEGARWGDGSGADLTSSKEYVRYLSFSQPRSLPIAVEQEYSLNPLDFREADTFLEPILRSHA